MGLAAPKTRKRFSKDPNNTAWSRSEDRFGHKILTGLGWKPGSTLDTKASSSYIRIVLREEGLALGAKRGIENFGLDAFQGLLGRLNGKSDEVLQKEQHVRSKVQMMAQEERAFGSLRFISGGFLRMEEEGATEEKYGPKAKPVDKVTPSIKRKRPQTNQPNSVLESAFKTKKSKKRKVPSVLDMAEDFVSAIDAIDAPQPVGKPKSKRKQKKSALESENKEPTRASISLDEWQTPKKRRAKSSKTEHARGERITGNSRGQVETEEERRRQKAQRKKERAERRARKEAKLMKKARAASKRLNSALDVESETECKHSPSSNPPAPQAREAQAQAEQPPAPSIQMVANPVPRMRGRHLIRQKHIQQKNISCMNEKALNEIFMLKARA